MKPINRRRQIEGQFLRHLVSNLKAAGCEVTPALRAKLKESMRSAAMVGACEERNRTLEFLTVNMYTTTPRDAYNFVINRGVLDVLGYKE